MNPKKTVGRKKQFRAKDMETFSEQMVRLAKAHSRWIVAACSFFVVICIFLWGYQHYMIRKNEQAAYAYYRAVQRWSLGSNVSQTDLDSINQSLSLFAKQFSSHPLSKIAELDRITLMAEQGIWSEVIKSGEQLLKELSPHSPLYPILLRHIAMAYENMEKFDVAANMWTQLSKNAPAQWRREIFWHLGKSLAQAGKASEAEENLRKALESEGVFPADFMIQSELGRLLRQSANNG